MSIATESALVVGTQLVAAVWFLLRQERAVRLAAKAAEAAEEVRRVKRLTLAGLKLSAGQAKKLAAYSRDQVDIDAVEAAELLVHEYENKNDMM